MSNFDITELYPGIRFYAPMLVGKTPDNVETYLTTDKFIGSEKKDGYWEMLIKHNNQVYMFARSKSKKDGWYTQKAGHVPHIVNWMMQEIPNDTIIIGEIYLPEKTSKDVTTILGCKEDKAITRQKTDGYLHFWIHDLLMYNGYDYVEHEKFYSQRYSDLCRYIDLGSKLIPQVEVASCVDNTYCNLLDVANKWIAEGKEGMVIRRENGIYLPGKRRPKEMFKIKQDAGNDLDFIVTGFVEPEKVYNGKGIETWPYWENDIPVTKAYYNNWKVGVILSLMTDDLTDFVECGKVTSGFTDADREDMAKNPNKYLHSTVTIGAMSLDKNNYTLRHPRFIGWHESKPAHQCTIESVFG